MVFRGKLIVIVGQEGQLVLDNGESIPLFRVGILGRGFDSIQIQSGYISVFVRILYFVYSYVIEDILRTHYKLMIDFLFFFPKGFVIGKQKCQKMKASCLSCSARKMENGNVTMIIDNTTRVDSF